MIRRFSTTVIYMEGSVVTTPFSSIIPVPKCANVTLKFSFMQMTLTFGGRDFASSSLNYS